MSRMRTSSDQLQKKREVIGDGAMRGNGVERGRRHTSKTAGVAKGVSPS